MYKLNDCVNINDKEFIVLSKVTYNNILYYYLVSSNEKSDLLMLKEQNEDNKTYLISLSEDEIVKVSKLFYKEMSKN